MAYAPVAIIHANLTIAQSITCWLDQAGYTAQCCADLADRLSGIEKDQYGLLIADEHAPIKNGNTLFEHFRKNGFSVPVIFLSEDATVQRAVEAVKMGASDYLSVPVEEGVLLAAVAKVYGIQNAKPQKKYTASGTRRQMIAHSESMLKLLSLAERVAVSSATVLIQGESGTGKELLARHLHLHSDRKNQPFVAMNCAALPENLVESELFGYEKGAFTGAAKARLGKFEQAHKGTLLLDEISEMPLAMQAKLLRVLQEKEVDHLGGGKPVNVDVRCIATSNQDLPLMVKEGCFRKDLYYRLRVIPLNIPPLRERKEDIPHLLTYFLHKFHSNNGTPPPKFDGASLEYIQQWHWPGNVRELENTVERALLINDGPVIGKASLYIEQEMGETQDQQHDLLVGLTVKELEKKLIGQTLSHLNQNRTHAAKMLGISIRTLRNKLREYNGDDETPLHSAQGKEDLVG